MDLLDIQKSSTFMDVTSIYITG